MDIASQLSQSHQLSQKVACVLQKRTKVATDQFKERAQKAVHRQIEAKVTTLTPWDLGVSWQRYWIDVAERSVLFWDTLRQRGDNYLEHVQQGQPPGLHFKYETVL